MRKLNRKGFTLVELLAVIVILAIVVGIALVTVLPTLQQSREKAFQLTADTAADYYQKQYELYSTGYLTTFATSGTVDYVAAGLKSDNYTSGKYKVNTTTGRVCVELVRATKAQKEDAEYYDAVGSEGNGVTLSVGCNGTRP